MLGGYSRKQGTKVLALVVLLYDLLITLTNKDNISTYEMVSHLLQSIGSEAI
jgi:hypothetical protein